MPAMVIADTDSTEIVGYVYEKDVDGLQVGMDVIIMTEGGNIRASWRIGSAAVNVGELSMFDTMTKITIKPDEGFNKIPGAVVDLKIVLSAKDGAQHPGGLPDGDGCVCGGRQGYCEKAAGYHRLYGYVQRRGNERTRRVNVVTSPDSVVEGSMSAIIEVRDLAKHTERRTCVHALQGITLNIQPGGFLAVMGLSGPERPR